MQRLYSIPFRQVNETVIKKHFAVMFYEEFDKIRMNLGDTVSKEKLSEIEVELNRQRDQKCDEFITNFNLYKEEAGWFAYAHSYAIDFASIIVKLTIPGSASIIKTRRKRIFLKVVNNLINKTSFYVEVMSKMKKFCCETMTERINHKCQQHDDPFECPDNLIEYSPKFDEYGIIIHDGGSSYIMIEFCPWCGTKFPESKRDLWFDTLEELGFDEPFEQDIPLRFKSDEWYKSI